MDTQPELPTELRDYWAVFMRRKFQFLVPFVLVIGSATALAFILPATFRSESTIIIERQSIPQDMVATTVTGYVQEQIQQIRQQIATHESLLEIADQFLLYPEEIESDPRGVVEKVKEQFHVKMVEVQASDPTRNGIRTATIAFNVGFSADNPVSAQAVATRLTERFLEYQENSRANQAEEVSAFLEDEAEKLRFEISELEREMAAFKQTELEQLPELMQMNLRLYENTETEIDRTEQRIRAYEDRIDSIQSELSLTPAYAEVRDENGARILTASERLSMLTANYLRATSRYSPEHPDIVRMTREIRILAEQTGSAARADELMNELVGLQEQLRRARQTYSEGHPEVMRLEKAVAAVQKGFEATVINVGAETNNFKTPPDNPRYVGLKTQLDSASSNRQAEIEKLDDLKIKLDDYKERLFQTPVVERDYKSLTRDYENAQRKYRDLRDKQLQARIAEELEAGESGEKWVVASNAYLPTLPESPNRIGIILLGVVFGTGLGLVLITLLEYLDTTIRGVRGVTAVLGVPPLAAIPRMPVPTVGQTKRL